MNLPARRVDLRLAPTYRIRAQILHPLCIDNVHKVVKIQPKMIYPQHIDPIDRTYTNETAVAVVAVLGQVVAEHFGQFAHLGHWVLQILEDFLLQFGREFGQDAALETVDAD
jgi:hypothetical protein